MRLYPTHPNPRRFFAPLLLLLLLLAVAMMTSPAVRAQTPTVTTLHNFGVTEGDGAYPMSGLIQASDGNFYGTTLGSADFGTVFRMTADGTVSILHHFLGGLTDGSGPVAGVIQGSDGFLYGTTSNGGAKGYGTVYKIALDGTGFTLLHSFSLGTGLTPYAALLEARDGFLYGVTTDSRLTPSFDPTGPGVLFRISKNGGDLVVLHTFTPDNDEGADPEARLIQTADGSLYGTAPNGGAGFSGTIFKYDIAVAASGGEGFSVRYAFSQGGAEGAGPVAGLTEGRDGLLYGTTAGSGSDDPGEWGVVYRISPNGDSAPTVLHAFTGYPDQGETPYAALIQASDGAFYGTTTSGGDGFTGTIFKITPDGVFTQLHAFSADGVGGAAPEGSLLQAADGDLYGGTMTGGPSDTEVIYNFGTLFRVSGLLAPPAASLPLQNLSTGRVAFWYLSGAGDTTVSGSAYASATLPAGWEAVGSGEDFNNDGRDDLVLQNLATRRVSFWFMNGAAVTAGGRADKLLPSGWRVRGAGDFNGDGKADLALENPATRQVSFWLMNGFHVVSGAYANLALPAGWRIAGVSDNNGDAKPDLVLENPATQRVAVWFMNGTKVTTGANASQALPSGWRVVGAGDFDNDGVASDLALENATTRKVALWYLAGTVVEAGAVVGATLPANWEVAGPN